MFPYMQAFSAWMFQGATQSVIDFGAFVLTIGCVALAICPIVFLIKKIFK